MVVGRINIKEEPAAVLLVLFSYIPLIFIGFILDILLVHFFTSAKESAAGLSSLSLWVYNNLAGYRFLPQEILTGIWLLMIIALMFNLFTAPDTRHFRIRFLYSFLYLWGLVLTAVAVLAFACVQPFDLLSARPEAITRFGKTIHILFFVELLVIVLLPAGFYWGQKRRSQKSDKAD